MKIFIYACEQTYGGLHGIEDFCVEEFDNDDFKNEEQLDKFLWDEYIAPMSWDVAERYDTIEYPEDEDEEIDEYEVVDGYWVYIKDDITLSVKELNKEACRLGAEWFRDKYCVLR